MGHLPRMTADGDVSFTDIEGRTHLNDTILSYRTSSGNVQEVRPGSPLPATDFLFEVVRGNVPGHKIMKGLGERANIQTTAAGEDVWRGNELSATPAAPASTVLIPSPATAGEQMTVVSEHANDDSGNVGAEAVTIEYLDANGFEQTEVVTMDGTTEVDTVATDIRYVNDFYVSTVGTNTVAVGNIRIFKQSDNTLVYNMIYEGGNKSLVPHRMVPANKTLYLRGWSASETSNKETILRIRADCTPAGERQSGVFLFKGTIFVNTFFGEMPLHDKIPSFCVAKVSAWSTQVASADTGVNWWGILVDD